MKEDFCEGIDATYSLRTKGEEGEGGVRRGAFITPAVESSLGQLSQKGGEEDRKKGYKNFLEHVGPMYKKFHRAFGFWFYLPATFPLLRTGRV